MGPKSLLDRLNLNTTTIKEVVTVKVNKIHSPIKKLRTKAWVFLSELEVDMKNWFKGIKQDVPELINQAGFKVKLSHNVEDDDRLFMQVEVHEVVTPDGYILQLHRIPPAHGAVSRPVFLQHGLLCSSACWVTNGRQR